MSFKNIIPLSLLFAVIISQTACLNSKKLTYFPSIGDTSLVMVNKDFEPIVQAGDVLLVAVSSLDPTSSALFNSASTGVSSGPNVGTLSVSTGAGLLVNAKGEIELPKLGKIVARGKTKDALAKTIQQALLPYLKEPVVNIRFMNYRVTVLGEVERPATLSVPNERISILEALGQCGDLTAVANRTNLLLIHENEGKREFHRINLNDNSLFKAPYYYLQSNDVVYVEPNKVKAYTSSFAPALLPTLLSSLSFVLVLVNSFRK